MLSPNDKLFVTYRTREHEREVCQISLVSEALRPLQHPSIFSNIMVGVGRRMVRVGTNLEKRYSRLADECGKGNLKGLLPG